MKFAIKTTVTPTLLVVLATVATVVRWAADPVVYDDAYISFRYAEHLVRGEGLVFNLGERVEGYTNFLWVLLAAGAIAVGLHPLPVTRVVGVLSYGAVVALTGWLLARGAPDRRTRLLILPLLGALVFPFGLVAAAGNGLETSFVSLLALLIGVTQHVRTTHDWYSAVGRAALPLVACLVRMDAIVFVAASALARIVTAREQLVNRRELAMDLVRRFGPTVVGLTIYLGLKLGYYGDILPNSYYAKAADQWQVAAGLAYLGAFVRNSPQIVLLIPAGLLGLASSGGTPMRAFKVFCGFAVAGQILYIVKVGGDFMYYRFAFEVYPLLVCAAGLGLGRLNRKHAISIGAAVVCVLVLSSTPPVLERRFGMQSIDDMNSFISLGREVGTRLAEVLPAGTRIATTLVGTIPFYSKLFAVDQWGLNDAYVARLPADPPPLRRGHVKTAPEKYLIHRDVHFVIGHPVVCLCDRPCTTGQPSVFIRLSANRCLRTRYLAQTPALTAHVCARPQTFVLDRVSCPTVSGVGGTPGPAGYGQFSQQTFSWTTWPPQT